MKKEWLLLAVTTLVTLFIALAAIRHFAPQWLGLPADLYLVQTDEKVPPFFEGVFRRADYNSKEFLLKDPYTLLRAKPLFPDLGTMGPHDILGFRNRSIPDVADIVFIGDSQTYGNNASVEENFPNQVASRLKHKQAITYSMAVGAWGAVQYFDMFTNAILLKPRVVVVAFYTGNDPLGSFQIAYEVERWNEFIPDDSLTQSDIPKVVFPSPESEWWAVTFKDGVETIFTPSLRLSSNLDNPVVKAGYEIMAKAAQLITSMSKPYSIHPVFTIIPTKELVYAKKVRKEALIPPSDYQQLISRESDNIDWLASQIKGTHGAIYIDTVSALQQAALSATPLYPSNINGHPVASGYAVIANTIAKGIEGLLPDHPIGLYALQREKGQYELVLIKHDGVWPFASQEIIAANGWKPGDVEVLTTRDIANLAMHSLVTTIDPERFGPTSVH